MDMKVIFNSTELKETLNENSIRLYPVPASHSLKVNTFSDYLGQLLIRVYNHTGQEVYMHMIRKPERELNFEINVEKWPSGVYILMLQDRHGAITERFVVK